MSINLLCYGDAGAATGFEKVMRNVLTYLHETGRFNITMRGLGYLQSLSRRSNKAMEFNYPYEVFPADSSGDFFGALDLADSVNKHSADMLFVTQDLWNITTYMAHKPIDLPAVAYFPIDCPNVKWSYAIGLGAVTQPVAYTNFGATEVAASVRDAFDLLIEGVEGSGMGMDDERNLITIPSPNPIVPKLNVRLDYLSKWQNLENWAIIPHGLDRGIFKPLDKAAIKKAWGIDEDAFTVGAINTNQFRKRQDTLFRMFAMLVHKVPRAKLILYCQGTDERGWDLAQLARYTGIHKHLYFVNEQVDRNLTEPELCELYNACDVMINTAGGEGWGLTSFEGAACGVAQVVPNWSATRELWKDHGQLMPVSDWRFEPRFLNTAHAILDVKAGGQILIELAENPDTLKYWQRKAFELAQAQPEWTDVAKQFERIFFKAMNDPNKQPQPRTFNQVLNERKGNVTSELRNAVYMQSNDKPLKY